MGSWTHKPEKRAAAKLQRRMVERRIVAEAHRAVEEREAKSRPPTFDDFGDTVWPPESDATVRREDAR